MCDHPIVRAEPGRRQLPRAQEDLLHGDVAKRMCLQAREEFDGLVDGWDERAEEPAALQGRPGVIQEVLWLTQVQEHRVDVPLVKTTRDVLVVQGHVRQQSEVIEVGARHVVRLSTRLVAVDVARRHHRSCQHQRQAAAARARLDDRPARIEAQTQRDLCGVFRVDDLGAARQLVDQVVRGGFEHEIGSATVGVDRAPQRLAENLGMWDVALVGRPHLPRLQPDEIVLTIGAHNQDNVAFAG